MHTDTPKNLILVVVILATLLLTGFPAGADDIPTERLMTESEISARCQREDNFVCRGDCLDGFATYCWYRTADGAPLPGDFRKSCYAYRHHSLCTPCANEFLIRENGELKSVSCELFYRRLSAERMKCRCLSYTQALGG